MVKYYDELKKAQSEADRETLSHLKMTEYEFYEKLAELLSHIKEVSSFAHL
jgi:ribosomal protein L20